MSFQAVQWAVRDAPMLLTEKGKPDTTARHVLAVLAECAQPDGSEARPSITTLQYRTGYDRRTVQRALRRLEDGGLIKAEGLKYGCTSYRLLLHVKRPASDWEALQKDEERQREMDAERQRRSRARRVTHSNDVTVTDAECVTGTDVTDADDVSHALSVPTSRTQNPDVTHATPPYKSFEPSGEKSSLSSSGAPNPAPPEPPAAPEEREKFATPKDKPATTAQRIVRSAQVLKDTEVDPFIAWATAKHNVRSPAWWRTVADDLPELVSAWRADPAQQRASLPPWCGQCGAGNPAAQGNPRFRTANDDGSGGKCPNCHPDMVAA